MQLLSSEQAIVERLAGRVDVKVYATADRARVVDLAQTAPSLHVALEALTDIDPSPNGRDLRFGLRWRVWVLARSARGSYDPADPLIAAVFCSLCGWSPVLGHSPLKPAREAKPVWRDGVMYLPIDFTTTLKFDIDRSTP